MRTSVDATKVQSLLREIGRQARGPGRVYLTGGASALLHGWRSSTVDVDMKLEPEPAGIFEALASLKDQLEINIELASPDQFLPSPPDWREHSTFIARHGDVDFFHYDFRAQALAKLARGHERDLLDVAAMLDRGLIDKKTLAAAYESIKSQMLRYPSLDATTLHKRVQEFLELNND